MHNIKRSILILATMGMVAGCATTDADGDHLEAGQPGVVEEAQTFGTRDFPMPSEYVIRPGDTVERSTRTCEVEPDGPLHSGACRAPLDEACGEDGGIPLPEMLIRATFEDGEVVAITVTVKCRFPAND
jgi:hypothetical protein